MSRAKFFTIALICSFTWYIVPGYLFQTLTSISWVCWIFSKSVTAQQLGSGMRGLGLGAFTLDWSTVSSFLFSPLTCPFFAIANIFIGYVFFLYVATPISYWGLNLYNAKNFPIFSSHLFTGWWFHLLLVLTILVSLVLCTVLKEEVQLPWWGLLFACGMAFLFTLPISIINVFSSAQFIGTIIAGTVNLAVAWWLLGSITNICHEELLPPNSPWTCPGDRVFFDASVIWGLVGPRRIFGPLGNYGALNWFFVAGAIGPIIVWLVHKVFPGQSWIPLINLPVLLGATASMPPATAVNYNSWVIVGTIFNFFIFRYRKKWWERYNYVLSAALDAGVAFMGVLIYFALSMENRSIDWWGTQGEHCQLVGCPTAPGIQGADVCPVF